MQLACSCFPRQVGLTKGIGVKGRLFEKLFV